MLRLIDRNDIELFAQISDTVYDNVLNQHINTAQFVDLQKLLGSEFYNDLIRNSTDAKYKALLNLGDYTYQSVTYTNHGLKAVLVHYAYGRYIQFGSQTDTPFGYVEKITNDSQPVDFNQKKSIAKMNQQTAFNYWESVKLFLDRNADDYPLWKNSCVTQRGTFRISKIGGSSDVSVNTASIFKLKT